MQTSLVPSARAPRWLVTTASLAFACALSGLAGAQSPAKPAPKSAATAATDPIVISVGTEHIRASEFQALIDGAPAQNRAAMNANKRAVADELAKMLALASDARKQGLDQSSSFKLQMLIARDSALAKAMVGKIEADTKPTSAQEQAYYTAHAKDYQQTKLRHILIGDNESEGSPSKLTSAQALAKAQGLVAKLKAGASFADLAKANSDDPGSKDKGGELGDITPGQTVPEFETAVNALPIGKVSDPIHTRFGYHIVEVEARSTEPFATAQPDISQKLQTDAVVKAIDAISAGAHLNDSYFGPAPKTPAKPGATQQH